MATFAQAGVSERCRERASARRLRTSGLLSLIAALASPAAPARAQSQGASRRRARHRWRFHPHRQHPHPPERDRRARNGPDLPARRPSYACGEKARHALSLILQTIRAARPGATGTSASSPTARSGMDLGARWWHPVGLQLRRLRARRPRPEPRGGLWAGSFDQPQEWRRRSTRGATSCPARKRHLQDLGPQPYSDRNVLPRRFRNLRQLRACRICRDAPRYGAGSPHEPRPVLQGSASARLCIASQAPGTRAHASGMPFSDPSGVRLRSWLGSRRGGVLRRRPGRHRADGLVLSGAGREGRRPAARRECAEAWRVPLFSALPNLELILVIGQYAQAWHLGDDFRDGLTGTVEALARYPWPPRRPACCRCRIRPGATTAG